MSPAPPVLERYLRIPRLGGLDVAADGRHVVVSVGRPSSDGKRFARDLWRVPRDGGAAERLTQGDSVDAAPRCLADGSVAFLSNRRAPAPDAAPADAPAGPEAEPTAQVWLLPPSGEPRPLTDRASSVLAFAIARDGSALVYRAAAHPGTRDAAGDRTRQQEREKGGATALVFDDLPVRSWDRFLGPRHEHLFCAAPGRIGAPGRDLTPRATVEADDAGFDVSPDGRFACAALHARDEEGRFHENLWLFDLATGRARPLTTGRDSYAEPRFAPDGRHVVAVLHENVPGRTGRQRLVLVPARGGGAPRPLAADLDLWPVEPVFAPDGRSVLFAADEEGHRPLFRVEVATGRTARLTPAGAFAEAVLAPDGAHALAIHSRLGAPPEVVEVPLRGRARPPRRVSSLAVRAAGRLPAIRAESLHSVGAGGRPVHSWLVLPRGRPPARGWPLLLWIHGGPLGAWTDGWHWRWNPRVFAAHGYAVLLPNPRISTGYGQAFIEEGHARWGAEPYEDLMGAVDAALEREDLDADRTAAMGGSFGGFMANWIAGRTDRFRCIVSHAGLWDLVGFHGTTDFGPEWEREFGGDPHRHPETYERWSPRHAARSIRTPMLIVHGEKDYRVPVAEALQAFSALRRLGVPSRFLYFPDENHWILRPPNIRAWHEAILAWLARWMGRSARG